jgi:hypothetical protein
MAHILIGFCYALFSSVWRRCFGSSGWGLPIIKYRAVQHIIGFLAAFGICFYNGYHWIQCLLLGAVLQGLYWARSHGCCFDYGHGKPDEKRYNQLWYWKYVRKIIPESQWYGFSGDFILMTVRYTLPAMLCALCLLCVPINFMGLTLACVYAFMWLMYDWWGLKEPTEYAEWVAGFTTGLFIAFG